MSGAPGSQPAPGGSPSPAESGQAPADFEQAPPAEDLENVMGAQSHRIEAVPAAPPAPEPAQNEPASPTPPPAASHEPDATE